MRKYKTYLKLRSKITENGLLVTELTEILNKSQFYISERLNAKNGKYFTTRDMFLIGKALNIPKDELIDYFTEQERKAN